MKKTLLLLAAALFLTAALAGCGKSAAPAQSAPDEGVETTLTIDGYSAVGWLFFYEKDQEGNTTECETGSISISAYSGLTVAEVLDAVGISNLTIVGHGQIFEGWLVYRDVVTVDSDGFEFIHYEKAQPELCTPEELMAIIRQCGVVGMGGATFPTHVKLSSGLGKVDTIIMNVSECEPYITADDRLCRENPEQVLSGLGIIMKILGLNEAHIGIEDNKPQAIEALGKHLPQGVQLDILPARYPQGAEKQLIQAITGRQIPSGGLPAAVGCAVFNAATCKAIHDAVYEGMPLIRRIVTVSGDIVMQPKNLLVPIGTCFNDLLEAVGVRANPYKVLSGGPMMGVAQYDLAVPVIKGCNAVTILGKTNKYVVGTARCIRCGRCIDVCPMHLTPVLMYKAMYTGDAEEMKALDMLDCIECGSCAYVCPAGVSLVLGFRAGKQQIRDAQNKAKK